MSRVKVYIELILHEVDNRRLIKTMERIMSIDVPRIGDFVVVTEGSDWMEVTSVVHRDEHFPEIRFQTLEFGCQPKKDVYPKDPEFESAEFYKAVNELKDYGWHDM